MTGASGRAGDGPRRTALAIALTAVMVGSVLTAGVVFTGSASAAPETVSSCGTIDQPGQYVLTSDLSASGEDCLDVTASDVTLDGNGHTIAGGGGSAKTFGVHVDGTGSSVSNVTVEDVTLTDWRIGLHTDESTDITVRNVTSVDNSIYGYWFRLSNDVLVEDSVARGHHDQGLEGIGFSVLRSHDMTFRNVSSVDNDIGMHFDNEARNIRVVDSTIRNTQLYSFWTQGYTMGGEANITADHLTVDGVELSLEAQNALLGTTHSPAVESKNGESPALPNGLVNVSESVVASRTLGPGSALNFTIHYDDVSGVNESTLGTYVYNPDVGSWTEADSSSADASANTASGRVVFESGTDVFLTAAGQAAAEEPEPEPEPANFSVSGLNAPSSATQGDTATVNATVENTGGSGATQTVEMRLDANGDGTPESVVDSTSVTLAAGASQQVSFQVSTDGVDAGTYAHGVFTANDSATAQLTVEAPQPDPTANVTFVDQSSNGTTVVVESVTMSEGGFVTIHNDSLSSDPFNSVVGVSGYLPAGTHENVTVTLFEGVPGATFAENASLEDNETLIAMPHLDSNGNGTYDFVATSGSADGPYVGEGGAVVDPAQIAVGDGTEGPQEPEGTYYQVDFVAGDPMTNLSADSLYADEDRLLRFAHGNTSMGITDRGRAWASEDVRSCVDASVINREGDTATITFTVNDSCSNVTMSLVSYTKPDAGFSRETADQQELFDATTETFGPGEHTITVDLPASEDDSGNATTTDLTAGSVPSTLPA